MVNQIYLSNQSNLEQLIPQNRISLHNLHGIDQDLGCLLHQNTTICYVNCSDLKINIESKINKIVFINCSNISINLNGLISGMVIMDCNEVSVKNHKSSSLNYVNVHDSIFIKVTMSKSSYKKTAYSIDKKYSVLVADNKDRSLVVRG